MSRRLARRAKVALLLLLAGWLAACAFDSAVSWYQNWCWRHGKTP